MKIVNLGRSGPLVSQVGLGCMGMSDFYGPSDESESISTIHAALDAGITMLDTGDFYGSGHNEMLIRRAIEGRRKDVFLAVKFGAMRGPDGSFVGYDRRPEAVKNFLSYTLRRLGTDYVDLYQPSRVHGPVPIEDTVGAMADLVRAGYIRHIGLSEASAATLRRAYKVHPITALQIEYSLVSRGPEATIFPAVRELGMGVTVYGILSRGLLSGSPLNSPKDIRRHMPRFQGENYNKNQSLVATLAEIGRRKGATGAQIAIAWVASRGAEIIPLVGARKRTQLAEALKALELKLTPEDLAQIEQAVPAHAVAGTRYSEEHMRWLDSENPVAKA
jgi:aryl-alcohol dehydrogenase-like predicted oxidoreductase